MSRRLAIRLGVLAVLLAAMGLFLLAGWGKSIWDWRESWQDTWCAVFMGESAYWVGQSAVQMTPLLFLLLYGFAKKKSWPVFDALCGTAAIVVSGLASQVIKHFVARPRPRLTAPFWEPFSSVVQMDLVAFPSGHASTSFALAAALSVRHPKLAFPLFLAASWVAAGRVVSGSHHVGDVLAGAVVGLVVGWVLGDASLRWKGGRA